MKGGSMKYLLKEGFRNIWSNRMMSLASVAILICCLVLTGVAILLTMNMNTAMKSIENENSVQVYLDDSLSTLESVQVGEEIKKLDNVASCEFISKDEAIAQYVDMLGNDGQILEGLSGKDNPLPNSYRVSFHDLSIYQDTANEISKIQGVYKINDYSDIASKLTLMHNVVLYGGIAIVIFLAIVSLLIISNTIRVTMHSRQLEISIMKSVGATSSFIRIPFLVEAGLLGLFSGIVSCVLLLLTYRGLANAVSSVLPSLRIIPIENVFGYVIAGSLVIGALFGVASGLFAINRYLKREGGSSLV